MKILLSGVETNNKGAELMLYAILQEIERRHPDAEVFLPFNRVKQGLEYVHTSLSLKYPPLNKFEKYLIRKRINDIFLGLHLPTFLIPDVNKLTDIDYFIDGSGFFCSDQWHIKDYRVRYWKDLLKRLSKKNCKIIFLPQAFGPVELPNTKKVLSAISKYSTVIMPRENVSYRYLAESGVVDMNKVKKYTDFTSLVDGVFPNKYEKLKNGICVIPNMRMIDKGAIKYEDYMLLLSIIIKEAKKTNRAVYILNHEGRKDEQLAYKCQEKLGNDVEVVTGLNGLEVKGLIASAYLVISARFHGVASSLNSCVPCLAMGWSHKYSELFADYKQENCMLQIDNINKALEKVTTFLDEDINLQVRKSLKVVTMDIKAETEDMWKYIWSL